MSSINLPYLPSVHHFKWKSAPNESLPLLIRKKTFFHTLCENYIHGRYHLFVLILTLFFSEKYIFILWRVVGYWNRLPREAIMSLSLLEFKCLGNAWYRVRFWVLCGARGWTQWSLWVLKAQDILWFKVCGSVFVLMVFRAYHIVTVTLSASASFFSNMPQNKLSFGNLAL